MNYPSFGLLLTLMLASPAVAEPAVPAAATAESVAPPLTDAEKKKLRVEFQKALSNQRSALAHQERSSMKELAASQKVKQKKWREEQKKARQQYFDQHMSGPERRQYVQDYLKKKQEFDLSLTTELADAKKSWLEKNQALKKTQKDQEMQFNSSLAQGIRPSF